ncbi:MAG TPA: hypothetical protein VKB68_07115 [Stellaceae bacterium]|nr:hypothetical protein [Stellaceae bacterium]
MIDFDVITGPGPSEKPREPAPKPTPSPPAKAVAETLPRATLLPRTSAPRSRGDEKSRP